MKDGAKFCSECASPLPGSAIEIESTPKTEESAMPAVVASEVVVPEVPAPPATQKRRSIKGLFLSLLLAIVAVVAMYVFYEDLGFVTPKTKAANVVLYVKDGQLYYNDLDTDSEYPITKDLPGVGASMTDIMLSVKLSGDGKTVFYPDRTGENGESYALYCVKPGTEDLPIKIGADVTSYDISDKGDLVYYINAEGVLYRHDLSTKTKIDKAVSKVTVKADGKEAVYLNENGLYYIKDNASPKRVSADVLRYDSVQDMGYVYFVKEDGFFCFDGKELYPLSDEKTELVGGSTNGMLVFKQGKEYYLVNGKEKYPLDCGENAESFWFSSDGRALYYLEGSDAYHVKLSGGAPGMITLCESDVGMILGVHKKGLVCLKDMTSTEKGDLYLGGKCIGSDILLYNVALYNNEQLAVLADYEDGCGTLVVYGENDGENLGIVEGHSLTYTPKGEILYLNLGDLYRICDGKPKQIASGVTFIIRTIQYK